MAERKRWIVTYTKHIKQKRKVYHDGFLDLQISGRKVMLYDEADNLLESRILKTDEVVSSGETLTFQAYLVDIGDAMGENKAPCDSKFQSGDQGCNRKSFSVLRPNFKKSFHHYEERKPNLVNKFPANSLSPSHKMIRVFKKREMQKYGALSPDVIKPSTKGIVSHGSADKEVSLSNGGPSVNPLCDGKPHIDSRFESNKLSKNVSSQKPLRDANQILSILQKPSTAGNVAEECSDNIPQRSVSPTKVPPESDTSNSYKSEAVSSIAPSDRKIAQDINIADSSQVVVPASSSDGTNDGSKTHLDDPPSFDLGI